MSVNEDGEQQRVTFTVKELLNRIDGKLDTMALAIAAKAEASVVERLVGRVDTLEATDRSNKELGKLYLNEYEQVKADVKHLKEGSIGSSSVTKYRRWLVATTIAAIGASSAITALATKLIH